MRGGIVETSASFEARSAPRSYPTKFGDFWPLGLVVLIWTLIVTVIVTPLYWPFH
jgi:di/tricarboxylate transporter